MISAQLAKSTIRILRNEEDVILVLQQLQQECGTGILVCKCSCQLTVVRDAHMDSLESEV